MEEKGTSKTLLYALGLAVVVFVIGAVVFFGGQDGQDGELDKVKLQLKWVRQAQFAGYLVAEEKGFYEEEGIDIEIQPGGVGINPVDNLISGDVDVAIAWTGNVLPAISKGESLVNIGQGFQRSAMRMMAKKTSGIEKPEDIKGKKVGTWPGGNELEPYAFIEKQGFDKDRDVTLVSQNFDMNQLLNDEIDLASAMIYNEYWLPMETGEYEESDFSVFDLEEEGAGMLQDGVFVRDEYLAENQDLLARFLRASMKGWDYAIKNPEESVDLMGIDFTENEVTAKDHQLRSIKEVVKLMTADDAKDKGLFYINTDKLQQTVDIAEEYVDEVEGIELDAIYTTEVWDKAMEGVEIEDYSQYLE